MKKDKKSEKKETLRHERLKRIFAFLMHIVKPVAKRRFNLTYEEMKDIEGPYLVLSNHTTDWDCIFLGLASTRQLYFVATEKIARMGIGGKLVRWLFDPILHYKGKQGVNTIKAIYRHIQKGHNVAMFPEGNRSFGGITCPIPPATGKVARMCGGTLVTYRWNGGYFSSPRWGKGIRRGRIDGHIVGIYTHEQLAAMTDDEIKNIIERDLYVDAYADQEKNPVRYEGRNAAEGIESMLFLCPKCGRIGTLRGNESRVSCTNDRCDFEAEYTPYGYLECDCDSLDGSASESGHVLLKLTDMDLKQREVIENMYAAACNENGNGTEPLFFDDVVCETIDSNHNLTDRKRLRLAAYPDRFEIGDALAVFDTIAGMAINQRNLLLIHMSDCDYHYEISDNISFSALKYLYLFRAAKGSVNGIL